MSDVAAGGTAPPTAGRQVGAVCTARHLPVPLGRRRFSPSRTRPATGSSPALLTVIPFLMLGFVVWQLAGSWLHWSDLVVFAHRLHPDRARDHGRLPPPLHPPQLQDRPAVARGARRARLGRDRGAGDLLGRRPPQAPRLLRRGGRPAQPARRARRGRLGAVQGVLPRPRRLALHPHPARLEDPLRAGPAQGPGRQLHRPDLRALGAGRPGDPVRARAWRIGGTVLGRHSPACSGAARCGSSSCTTSPTRSTRSATCSASGTSRPSDESRNLAWLAIPPSARPGTTTTTPSRRRPCTD